MTTEPIRPAVGAIVVTLADTAGRVYVGTYTGVDDVDATIMLADVRAYDACGDEVRPFPRDERWVLLTDIDTEDPDQWARFWLANEVSERRRDLAEAEEALHAAQARLAKLEALANTIRPA